MNSKKAVLEYLLAHPVWHYGMELVNAGLASRSTIEVYLCDREKGSVVRRDSPEPPPRPQYRAIGRQIPVDTSPSPAGA